MKKLLMTAISVAMISGSATVVGNASDASYEEGLKARQQRQAVFELLSMNVEALALMGRGRAEFDEEIAVRNAQRILTLAPMITETFELDTRPMGIPSRAKDLVWDNWDTFMEHRRDLEIAAQGMVEAATDGNRQSVAAAMRPIGQACGSCHDLFRFLPNDPALAEDNPFRGNPRPR